MDDHEIDTEVDPLRITVEPGEESPALAAEIVVANDRPAECTIYPPYICGFEQLTTWISAEEGPFVSLADIR